MFDSTYHFVTRWRVEGTPEEVYTILDEPTDLVRWWPAVWLGLGVTCLVEGLQFFVYSRYFDTTDILTGTAAVCLGWHCGQAVRDARDAALRTQRVQPQPRLHATGRYARSRRY